MKETMQLICVILFIAFTQPLMAQPPTHQPWTDLLERHVDQDGTVNYQGFISDSIELNSYLQELSLNPPTKKWSEKEELAYWINVYNAFTIQLVIRNYPLKSIKDLGGMIYQINTTWDLEFVPIGEEVLNLNEVEHDKIRDQFKEPRIHFAVNCASYSCPKLRNEAYTAEKLDAQLEDQALDFFNDPSKNILHPTEPKLSKILDWYADDFKSSGKSIVQYVNQYAELKLLPSASLDYMDYNWTLNE